jgi:hypothetical protein
MPLQSSILKVLAYFDLFNYPVSAEEILFFLDQDIPACELDRELEVLAAGKYLFRLGPFYSLRDDPRAAERRVRGNRHAEELLVIADRVSRFLYQFPYVRGVGISGSLSKHYADEDADIDYFIITRSNRLWIARTFMHLFKKWSFLTGRQHWYCMNYYVDEEALEIEEKNIFTATELITLLPACGNGGLVKFFDANNWATAYFPHYRQRKREAAIYPSPTFLKKVLEKMFDNRAGDRLDDFLHRLTSRRWKNKEERGALNDKGDKMSLKTGKHFSRPNPEIFQQKILGSYSDRLKEFEGKWGMVAPTLSFEN